MSEELKPCPFCGGKAELDANQAFRAFVSGEVERAVAVYCTECTAQISVCVPDVPDIQPEHVVATWNRRDNDDAVEVENAILRDYVGDGLLRSDYKSAAEMRVEIKRLRDEVMHLRIYAPGQRKAHEVRMAPHIGPTDFAAWGIKPETKDAAE